MSEGKVIEQPYLLFLGDAHDQLAAKTARVIVEWRRDWCLGQLRLEGCQASAGMPDVSVAQAAEAGARTLVVGVANRGGVIPDNWLDTLGEAIDRGMDLASGLHMRLSDIQVLSDKSNEQGTSLFDVRHPERDFPLGSGEKRPGKRLLTVGSDASVGKMYTTLAIERELKARGVKADFRATGQTGIFIAGDGVSVDAVVADFISGAAEWLSPANAPDHWDLVEGQGSLFHPSFAGVTLGLIHGAQPDAIVLCHEPSRTHMRGLPGWPLPSLSECLAANLAAARLTNEAVFCAGVAINTSALDEDAAARLLGETSESLGLPCVDPMRVSADFEGGGVAPIVDRLL
ncbi:MAG: N-acetyltransferase DgcN [Alphaproteobacteria bacterium]